MYIGIINGFFEKVEAPAQAFQMARVGDAQALQSIVVDSTEIVNI